MTMVVIATQLTHMLCTHLAQVYVIYYIFSVVFQAIIPVAVLVINVVVVYKVRRAAINAAANLGVQPHHHQSTSSSSAVPTVMLVATSFIYLLIYSTLSILTLIAWSLFHAGVSYSALSVLVKSVTVSEGIFRLVFAYNFYVYLITGKKFRSELHKLFCCCLSSSSSSAFSSSATAPATGTTTAAAAAVVFTDDAEVTIHVNTN